MSVYDVNCSISNIDNFINMLDSNLYIFNSLFKCSSKALFFMNNEFGGLLGDLYSIISNNLDICKNTYEQSLNEINYDISEIDNTVYHNEKMIENINMQINNLEAQISSTESEISKLRSQKNENNASAVNSAISSYNSNIRTLNENTKACLANIDQIKKINNELLRLKDRIIDKQHLLKNTLEDYEHRYSLIKGIYKEFIEIEDRLKRNINNIQKIAFEAKNFIKEAKLKLATEEKPVDINAKLSIKEINSLLSAAVNIDKTINESKNNIYDLQNLLITINNTMQDNVVKLSTKKLNNTINIVNQNNQEMSIYSTKLKDAYKILANYIEL